MSFDKLDDHLWSYILDFLRPPLPKPLSGVCKQEAVEEPDSVYAQLPDAWAPGVTGRNEVRAPALAVLMRVSIAFNRLASLPLYKRVITDNFTSFDNHRGSSAAHPQIASKTALLHLTRTLYLEYGPRIPDPALGGTEPTYLHLMNNGGAWEKSGMTQREIARILSINELGFLVRRPLRDPATDIHLTRFPALTKLAIGAIWGGRDALWGEVMGTTVGLAGAYGMRERWPGEAARGARKALLACQHSMIAIFCRSPIIHFCQRGHLGPYSLPQTIHWVEKSSYKLPPAPPLFTFHYRAEKDDDTVCVPAAIGCTNRWILERPIPASNFHIMTGIFRNSLLNLHGQREHLWSQIVSAGKHGYHRQQRPRRPTLDLTIYGSTVGLPAPSDPIRTGDERDAIAMTNKALHNIPRVKELEAGQEDNVRWRTVSDCPSCEACGWLFDHQAAPHIGSG